MSPPEDLLQIAHLIADICGRLKLQYAFGGALAQNIWGTVRATQDVDVLIAISRIQDEELRRALADAGFSARDDAGKSVPLTVERMAAQERHRHLLEIYYHLVKVEIFVPFLPLQHSILRRAAMLPMGGRTVPITTAEDLIVLKMAFHREKDLRDVRSMIWSQKGALDLAYVRTWAAAMLTEEHREELEGFIRRYDA